MKGWIFAAFSPKASTLSNVDDMRYGEQVEGFASFTRHDEAEWDDVAHWV